MATANADLPAIFDIEEAADHLGVSRQWLDTLRSRGQMPDPDVTLGQSPGWLLGTLDEWWVTRPKRGRPRKDATE